MKRPTKIASTQGTVPPDTFSRDLLEPSVDMGTGASVETSTPEPIDTIEALLTVAEVMEIEQPSQHSGRLFD
jgi:hypothetical protein